MFSVHMTVGIPADVHLAGLRDDLDQARRLCRTSERALEQAEAGPVLPPAALVLAGSGFVVVQPFEEVYLQRG